MLIFDLNRFESDSMITIIVFEQTRVWQKVHIQESEVNFSYFTFFSSKLHHSIILHYRAVILGPDEASALASVCFSGDR